MYSCLVNINMKEIDRLVQERMVFSSVNFTEVLTSPMLVENLVPAMGVGGGGNQVIGFDMGRYFL